MGETSKIVKKETLLFLRNYDNFTVLYLYSYIKQKKFN